MGIVSFNAVRIRSNLRTPCRGGAFNVQVDVLGKVNRAGGRFRVSLWDDDLGFDDELARSGAVNTNILNKRLMAGVFFNTVRLNLNCDGACDVAGRLGSSGDNPASVYAYIQDLSVAPNKAKPVETMRLPLLCVPAPDDDDDCGDGEDCGCAGPEEDGLWGFPLFALPEDGGSCETARGVTLDVPAGAVAPDTRVEVTRMPPELNQQFFPGEIGIQMRTLQIGRFDTRFHKPVGVTWKLKAAERRLLTERDGSVVVFDPEDMSWTPLEGARVDDEQISYRTDRGGLFAVAGHSVFNDFVPPVPGMCRASD